MFPITPCEIGPGFVEGYERTVTRTERLFTQQQPPPSWEAQVPATSSSPTDGAAGTVLFFGVGGFLTREQPLMGRSFDVKLAGEDQLAVIVWPVH
eukprot:COSAG05_NODE_5892_length_1064_cov_86.653886_1_plen_95_part_00